MKTAPTAASVKAFIDAIPDEDRRRDCRAVMKIMRAATGASPKMWGPSIVGYGRYHYRYDSGREGDWFLAGFSPRKQDLTVYIMSGFPQHAGLMKRLGKHKTGSSCLYLKRLDDVDLGLLEELVRRSVAAVKKRYARP
jgi:hypothetical protein